MTTTALIEPPELDSDDVLLARARGPPVVRGLGVVLLLLRVRRSRSS